MWGKLRGIVREHGRAAMVTVVGVAGSTPREAGARMLIRADGGFTGTIGGGTLEWKAIALAQAMLARADPHPQGGGGTAFAVRSFALGPELGQCCGGRMELAFELFDGSRMAELTALAEAEVAGDFASDGRVEGGKLVRDVRRGDAVSPGTVVWDHDVLTEGFGDPARPLVLFGAGHVGRALVLALAPLPFRVTWVDPRPDAFPAMVPAGVACLQPRHPPEALAAAPDGAFVLVMTHSHALDLELVHAALAAGRFPYVGLIGSATKRARFVRQLRDAGVAEEGIAAMVCPIGVGGIKSKLPAVIAAATAAELLQRDEALRAAARPPVDATRRRLGGAA